MTGKKFSTKLWPFRKLQNQDPPIQHLAKENENVSGTAKKLCHYTYHGIHSINIRTVSKLLAPVV